MSNRVGNNPFTPEEFKSIKQKITEVVASLKAHGVLLSSEERTRISRPRIGSEPYVNEMISIVDKYEIESKKRYPLQGMHDDLVIAADFQALVGSLQEAVQVCEDTIRQAKSESWEAFLFYRGVTQSMADRDPEIENDIKNIDAFMSITPKRASTPTPDVGSK